MKIVSNFDKQKHFYDLTTLAQSAKEAWIISPFLSSVEIVALLSSSEIDKVTIITTVNSFSDSMKVRNILELAKIRDFCAAQGISLHICNDNKLHAKIYAFYDSAGAPIGVIISSANATRTGLRENHELGVLINSGNKQNEIVESFKRLASAISPTAFDDILANAERYKAAHPKQVAQPAFNPFDDVEDTAEKKDESIDTLDKTDVTPIDGADIRYFVKPVGNYDSPYSDGNIPDPLKLHFSKRHPRSIRIGDILICYAVMNWEKIIGVYKVTSEIKKDLTDIRYPHYVESECLSRKFTSDWWTPAISITRLADKFILEKSGSFVTNNGGKNLNGLQRGCDHIWLTDEFAHYIIDTISKP